MKQHVEYLDILPVREGFSPQAFGAISLSLRDLVLHSKHRLHTLVVGASDAPPFEGIAYQMLDPSRHFWETSNMGYMRRIMRLARETQPKLITVHNRPSIALKLAKSLPYPVALFLHNDPQTMRRANTAADRTTLLKHLAGVCSISQFLRQRFLEGVDGALHHKVHDTPLGLPLTFAPAPKKHQILFVGRITPYKGVLEYAQGLVAILPAYPDWHGYVVGGQRHSESAKLSPYEQQVATMMDSAGAHAHYEGFQPYERTMQMFAESHIAVIPSLWDEPFGRTAVEALATGCAVITSGRGGLKEIVGDAGIVLSEVTGATLAAAMRQLIDDAEYRTRVQHDAVKRAALFDITRCAITFDIAREKMIKK